MVVIGGGDTGSDCIGTSFRQGAKSVTQLEIMPAPPEHENKGLTWPNWPLKMRTSSSQAEGAKREFAVLTQKFSGVDGKVQKLHCVQVDDKFKPIAGTEFELDAQLVLLAMGFVHPVHEGLLKTLGVDLDQRGNVRANMTDYQTSRAERVLRRRHAPRPVAGGVGDPRGPALRAGDRSVSDGIDDAAATNAASRQRGQATQWCGALPRAAPASLVSIRADAPAVGIAPVAAWSADVATPRRNRSLSRGHNPGHVHQPTAAAAATDADTAATTATSTAATAPPPRPPPPRAKAAVLDAADQQRRYADDAEAVDADQNQRGEITRQQSVRCAGLL